GDEAFMRRKDPELERIYAELTTLPDQEDRVRAFADLQSRIYEVIPAIKLGDQGMAQAAQARVANFKPFRFPRMYNVWFE
ncbi:MAG TPA: hypothetical protein VFG47_04685, partial [Geminicoccaceae bacterium]|nr:hypothetical protein [Geminicoccaceae bacterium]